LPGAALVRAILRPTSALIKLDLPTFDRPTQASSRNCSFGKPAASMALTMNSAITYLPRSPHLSHPTHPSHLSHLSHLSHPS